MPIISVEMMKTTDEREMQKTVKKNKERKELEEKNKSQHITNRPIQDFSWILRVLHHFHISLV